MKICEKFYKIILFCFGIYVSICVIGTTFDLYFPSSLDILFAIIVSIIISLGVQHCISYNKDEFCIRSFGNNEFQNSYKNIKKIKKNKLFFSITDANGLTITVMYIFFNKKEINDFISQFNDHKCFK
ncbi:MAG TPA: hypothetical protein ENK65_00645 [Helicobacteraceae bacterium]|nr:hypothetical protein [Helicobacteraceae bacterium]